MTQLSNRLATILTTTLNEAERRALVSVLRARPELTLEKLQDCFTGRYGDTLRSITVGELLELDPAREREPDGQGVPGLRLLGPALEADGGPPIDRNKLELAKRSHGIDFDELVHQTIAAAGGRAVSASYLRARVGGPRWKLQGSLRRLVEADHVDRFGVTSSTRYRVAAPKHD